MIVLIIVGIVYLLCDKDTFFTDYEYLYDKAIDYLAANDNGKDKNKEDYQVFYSYEGFGIDKDDKYQYAYLWVLEEAYFVQEKEIKKSSSSSIPYKFTFKDNGVLKVEKPEDGNNYEDSVKKIFPFSIRYKILNFDSEKLVEENTKKVKNYYKYLKN